MTKMIDRFSTIKMMETINRFSTWRLCMTAHLLCVSHMMTTYSLPFPFCLTKDNDDDTWQISNLATVYDGSLASTSFTSPVSTTGSGTTGGDRIYHDISWLDMTWQEISWHFMTWYELTRHFMTYHLLHWQLASGQQLEVAPDFVILNNTSFIFHALACLVIVFIVLGWENFSFFLTATFDCLLLTITHYSPCRCS